MSSLHHVLEMSASRGTQTRIDAGATRQQHVQ